MGLITSRKMPLAYHTSTYGGVTRDYQSLQAWWDARCKDKDMVTSEEGEVLVCYDDDAPYDDTIDALLDTGTDNADYFAVIKTASGHEGRETSGVRFERINIEANTTLLYIRSRLAIYDIAAKTSALDDASIRPFGIAGVSGGFVGCMAYDCTGNGLVSGFDIYTDQSFLVNCVAKNIKTNATTGDLFDASGAVRILSPESRTFYIYNTTITDSTHSFFLRSWPSYTLTLNLKNTIHTDGVSHQEDGTNTITQTTNATTGVTFDTDGYSLASTDTGAIDGGTDLSADATFAFNDDFFGRYRPGKDSLAWDIGAHEYDGYLLKILGTLKEKESGAGSAEDYILLKESDGSVIEAGTAAVDGTVEFDMTDETTTHTLIMPDKDGEYTAVAASLLTAVKVTS